jgi:ATP-binding cassette, subfamily A (ABC1), member 3
MSVLIDTMNPQTRQWLSHLARILSTNLAFCTIYLPGTMAVATIIATRIFYRTSAAFTILFNLLMLGSLATSSNFIASFFRKAQLSGITIVISSCLLAIAAQWAVRFEPISGLILSLLFPPINYVSWTIYVADAEGRLEGATWGAPYQSFGYLVIPGFFYLAAALFHIVLFPLLTLLSERALYGTTSSKRKAGRQLAGAPHALKITNFSRTYRPGLWARIAPWKRAENVYAVSDLSFTALRGSLVALLGENGSGKTTTISAITALEKVRSGLIELDGTGGLGFCPQKNVLWGELTVLEHVRIFNQLKAASRTDSKDMLLGTIKACDLGHKATAQTKTLSGGQKRKVQLAMAFTGGSKVCCIDEASSGLDPVSRRKIWDILLTERGHRTLLFTTHALDEADALSDYIVILQKGRLKMEGSAVQLKQQHGGDYQVSMPASTDLTALAGHPLRHDVRDGHHYLYAAGPREAGRLVELLEAKGFYDYEIEGPTIEQVFLRQAENNEEWSTTPSSRLARPPGTAHSRASSDVKLVSMAPKGIELSECVPSLPESREIGFMGQWWVLFRKRLIILPRNWVPYFFAVLIPIITGGVATSFLHGFAGLSCLPSALALNPYTASIADFLGRGIPLGPTDEINESRLQNIFEPYLSQFGIANDPGTPPSPPSWVFNLDDTYAAWDADLHQNFRTIAPGGVWLGDSGSDNSNLTIAYLANGGMQYAASIKAAADAYLMDTTIISRFSNFALPLAGSTGDSLQLVIYFGLAMSIAPGLYALYPSYERTRNIKALQYSNGVRPAPLWLAHVSFDALFVFIVSTVSVIIFSVIRGGVWFAIGHLWPVFFFFGISSILFAYTVSLFLSTQLGAFAFAAGYQAVTLLIYFFM